MCEKINSMISPSIGEIFKSSLTGKVYKVKRILEQLVVLQSLNGLNQVLTAKENLNWFYKRAPKV